MLKKSLVLLSACLLCCTATGADAASFVDVVDFEGSENGGDRTYVTIYDGNSSSFVGLYEHVVTFDPAAASVTSASLVLDYRRINGDVGGNSEVWALFDREAMKLGELAGTSGNEWTSQEFELGTDLLAGVYGTSWTIGFKLAETTNGTDRFDLDKSTLTGDYTPVPLPGAAVLLASGLTGLAVARRRLRGRV